MPLSTHRSAVWAPGPGTGTRMWALRGGFGCGAAVGGASGATPRVSRRALGISSVFLQGLRSSAPAAAPRAGSSAPSGQLNGRLLEYSEKVRALEEQNQQLQEQIQQNLEHRSSRSRSSGQLRTAWQDVYRQVSDAILENAQLTLQTESLQGNAEDLKERCEGAESLMKEVQEEISSLYKVIQDAELTKAELQQQMDAMGAELSSLEQTHEQDVQALCAQMGGPRWGRAPSSVMTSLDQILAYVRDHWEEVTERNRAEALAYLEPAVAPGVQRGEQEEAEALRLDCSDAAAQIVRLQADTESMVALKRGLKSSLADTRHWHQVEQQNLDSVVARLEAELADLGAEMEQQRHAHDALLRNKEHLEQEVGLYGRILDREESRVRSAEPTCSPPEGASPDSAAGPGPSTLAGP